MFNINDVSRMLREARIQKNLTQNALADQMGVTYQAVSNWVGNDRDSPYRSFFKAVGNERERKGLSLSFPFYLIYAIVTVGDEYAENSKKNQYVQYLSCHVARNQQTKHF